MDPVINVLFEVYFRRACLSDEAFSCRLVLSGHACGFFHPFNLL